jgi:hypothetical protein
VEGMRPRGFDEARKFGMRYEDSERVEDYRGSMLSGPLRADQIAELSSLRSAAMTPRTCPCRGALSVIIGVPMLNEHMVTKRGAGVRAARASSMNASLTASRGPGPWSWPLRSFTSRQTIIRC